MREFFEAKQAAKMIINDMVKFNIPFDKAWSNYNNEWYDNKLFESDKESVKQMIVNIADKLS